MNIYQPDPEQYRKALEGTAYVRLRRGAIRGNGADRLDLLHRLSTNAISDLKPGEETSTILTSDKGRVIEVLRVIAFEDHVLMLTAGTDVESVRAWLDKYTIMDDFTTEDVTAAYAVAGVYGEHAKSLIAAALGMELPDAGRITTGSVGGYEVVTLRDARLTGAGGFLLLMPAVALEHVTGLIAAQGAAEMGEETYETLRIESGIPTIGRELSELYNPLEAGMTQLISFTKGCYIGQEVIARLDTYDKVQRHLVGLTFDGTPGDGGGSLEVHDPAEGRKIGAVTSLAWSPSLGRTIGLAYVRTSFAVPGADVRVVSAGTEGGAPSGASITRLPFDR